MTLFKNKPFLTASMFLAVLGSTSLLSSPGFSMDPAAEDVVDTTQAPVRPYPAERASVIEDLLAKFRDPATPEDERTKAGMALLFTEKPALSYGKEPDDFKEFFYEQVFSLSVDERIPVQTRIKYVSGFIEGKEGDSFFYYSNCWHSPYTERASDILLPFLEEENGLLTHQRRFTLLRNITRCGNTAQIQRASGVLLSFFDDAASPHLVSVQERLDLLDNLIRANGTTGQCVPPILRALPLLEDLTNSIEDYKRVSTAKAIIEIGRVWQYNVLLNIPELIKVWQTAEEEPGGLASFRVQAAQVLLRLAEKSSISQNTRIWAAKTAIFQGAPAGHLADVNQVLLRLARRDDLSLNARMEAAVASIFQNAPAAEREQSCSVLLDLSEKTALIDLFRKTALYLDIRFNGLRTVILNGTEGQRKKAATFLLDHLSQKTTLSLDIRFNGLREVILNGTEGQEEEAYVLLRAISPEEMSYLIKYNLFQEFIKDLFTAHGYSAEIERKREKAETFLNALVQDQRFSQDERIRIYDDLEPTLSEYMEVRQKRDGR